MLPGPYRFFVKIFAVGFGAKNAVKNRFLPPPTFQCTGCGLNGAETDVTSHQDPVSHSAMARMTRQMPLGRREQRKIVSQLADTTLHDLVQLPMSLKDPQLGKPCENELQRILRMIAKMGSY